METFTALKKFVNDPLFSQKRDKSLSKLEINSIDAPIIDIISGFSKLSYCFTLQSCYGHFLHEDQKIPRSTEPLPISDHIKNVEYRIAYLALCIQNSERGRDLFHDLARIPSIDPEYIQFGCAEWFWKRQLNSFALQVEPQRYMTKDKISVSYQEALHIEKIRDNFFHALKGVVQKRPQ